MAYLRRNTKAAHDVARDAYLQEQGRKATNQAQSDRYNGELMRKDPLLSRLLAAWRFLDAEEREEVVRRVESLRGREAV